MIVILAEILVTLVFAYGLFTLIGFKLPSVRSVKAISKLTEKKKPFRQTVLYSLARLIVPIIHISPYRQNQLTLKLKASGKMTSPELHIALAVSAGLIYFAFGLLFLPVFPIGAAALFAYSVIRFFKDLKVKGSDEHRISIEAEMPRFTSYIVQSTAHRSDLAGIIHGYRDIAGKDLASELDMLLTDMRTKNREAALVDFESRIDSPLVSELTRGLIGIERGDDMKAYLSNVEVRMNEHEVAALKKEAAKRPDMLVPASWLLFISIMLIYLSVMGMQLFTSIKSF